MSKLATEGLTKYPSVAKANSCIREKNGVDNKMKKLLLTLVVLSLILTVGCYDSKQLEEDLGGCLDLRLVALDEVSYLGGHNSGSSLERLASVRGGPSVAFALQLPDTSVVCLTVPIEKVRIVYEDVEPYAEIVSRLHCDEVPSRTKRMALAERIKLMAIEIVLHMPSDCEVDFIRSWGVGVGE